MLSGIVGGVKMAEGDFLVLKFEGEIVLKCCRGAGVEFGEKRKLVSHSLCLCICILYMLNVSLQGEKRREIVKVTWCKRRRNKNANKVAEILYKMNCIENEKDKNNHLINY